MKNKLSIAEITKIIEPFIANHEKGKEILEYLQYLSKVENEIKIDFGTLFRILKTKQNPGEPLYINGSKVSLPPFAIIPHSFLEGTSIYPYLHHPLLFCMRKYDEDNTEDEWKLSICDGRVFLRTKDYGDVFSLDVNDLFKEEK